MESQVSFSQGMKIREMWEEVLRRFDKENSAMNAMLEIVSVFSSI